MRLAFPCDEEYIQAEIKRLCDLFVPEYDPSEITVSIGKGKYSYAAVAFPAKKKLVVYPAYHYRYPDDFKSTLLHELGHFAFCDDPNHGPKFREYYELLLERQKDIEEKIIPENYTDFLYAKPVREYRYKYVCCGNELLRKKRVILKCKCCGENMSEKVMSN